MAPQALKVVSTYSSEISGCTILSRLLHSRAPHSRGVNGNVQSDLATLAFKNGEQLEYFHIIILRLQQEIILSGETVSRTRLPFQYIKALSKSDRLKEFMAPKMKYLITFLDNNGKYAVYTGGNIHGIYHYIDIIGVPTKLTTSGQCSHHFGPHLP